MSQTLKIIRINFEFTYKCAKLRWHDVLDMNAHLPVSDKLVVASVLLTILHLLPVLQAVHLSITEEQQS